MKLHQLILLAAMLGLISTMVSCETVANQDSEERANGIPAGDERMSRNSIYSLQEKTMRTLAH